MTAATKADGPAPRPGGSALDRYRDRLAADGRATIRDYQELWAWSVRRPEEFWPSVWDFFEVVPPRLPDGRVVLGDQMPGVRWFPEDRLNYVANVLRHPAEAEALIGWSPDGAQRVTTYGELAASVASVAAELRRAGVRPGDRVAAVLPHREEAVIAFLATACVGGIWALCAPEFGVSGILGRLEQIEPTVLITTDAYAYQGKVFDVQDTAAQVLDALAGPVYHIRVESGLVDPRGPARRWSDLLGTADERPLIEPVAFEHPLWVLYSSGTTGVPKAMVHSHGGIVLEHLKSIGLHNDIGPGDRFFWYTTPAWMMWNYLVGGLLAGATVVLYDGPPEPETVWRLAAEVGVTFFGASPGFFEATRAADLRPEPGGQLRTVGSTGSPLHADPHRWLAETLGPAVRVAPVSGGTDVCSGFVGGHPWGPSVPGQMQARMLGVDAQAVDADGQVVVDEVGELVVRGPMPSMPLSFWGDDGSRYRDAYFTAYPGVWRHGDWIRFTADGAAVISGRSDSTLNRGGVRMGSSEFYAVLAELPSVTDALVVDTSGGPAAGGELIVFVVANGPEDDDALGRRVTAHVRRELSPRHAPDRVVRIDAVPYTLTGKKTEVPIKRLLQGTPVERAVDLQSLRNPEAVTGLLAAAGLR